MRLVAEGQRVAELGTRAALLEAIDKYKIAYDCSRKTNFRMGMGMAMFAKGTAHSSLYQKRQAIAAFLEASTYINDLGDPSMNGIALASIGMAYSDLGEWKRAIEFLDKALALVQIEKKPEFLSTILCGLGGAYIKLGQKQKSLEYLNRAVSIAKESQDPRLEVNAQLMMGAAFSSFGQERRALESVERALQITREQKYRSSEVSSLLSRGGVHNSLGDRQAALRDYNEALRIGLEANDSTSRSTVLNNIAGIYSELGEIDRAIALYEESIRICESEGEPEAAASSLNGLALIYDQRAEPFKALSYYRRALALARAAKHQGLEAATLVNISRVYDSFNQHEQALEANNDAAAVFRALEDPSREATVLANQGAIYNELGRYSEAFNYLNRALELHRATENRGGEAYTLHSMGKAYSATDNLTKAIEVYKDALALMTNVEDRTGQAVVSNSLGSTYDMMGDYQMASEYFLRALSLARSAVDRRGEATLLSNLGFLHEKKGDLKEAEDLYGQAIEARERMRTAARLDEFRTELSSDSAALYSRAILLKIKSGKSAEAFELSERAKARTLLDQMSGPRIDMRKSADRELIEKEQSLRFELASLEKKLRQEIARGGAPEACAPLQERLKQGQQAYTAIVVRLKESNPEYAELQGYSPASRVEIQRLLGPETTLLSYFVTPNKTLIFVVTRDSLRVVEAPAGEKELRSAIDWFRSFASLRDQGPDSLKQLNEWLIAPVRQYIKTPMICLIPHGILHHLPFGALFDGKGYFGEQHTVYYLPAASLLPFIEKRGGRGSKRMLALAEAKAEGWPSLHYVDREAEAMARLFHGRALLTGQASKAEFLRLAGSYDILHIASHAELNTRSPLFSRILLTPDQDGNQGLEVREVYDLDLSRTNLVVLSACETHLGAQSRGDDIVGLNRAFIYAGASTVIASLWTVDDAVTGLLMRSFYTHLKSGMGKAEALRAAQSETRRKHPNPYYWAAFVLTGDAGLTGPTHRGALRRGAAPGRK